MKSARSPLEQVIRRMTELEKTNHPNSSKVSSKDCYMQISSRKKDSCFVLKNGDFGFVQNKSERGIECDVIKAQHTQNLFINPLQSKDYLNIAFIKQVYFNNRKQRKWLDRKVLEQMVVLLPQNEGYALFPLLHGVENQCKYI